MELTLVGLQVEREFWADDYHRVGFAVCAQFTEHIEYGDITFWTFGLSTSILSFWIIKELGIIKVNTFI